LEPAATLQLFIQQKQLEQIKITKNDEVLKYFSPVSIDKRRDEK